MSRLSWSLTDMMSELLDRDERNAVLGDLMESGANGGRALRDVLGLVVRRQSRLWMNWRPWLALVAIIVPVGIVLSHVSRHWGQGVAVFLWVYVHDQNFAALDGTIWSTGGEGDLRGLVTWFCLNAITLVMWSLASGWVLGSLSRRAIWTTGPLFYFALVFGTVGTDSIGRLNNTEIFSPVGYGVILPAIQGAAFVVAPALWGMYRGVRSIALPPNLMIMAVVSVALLTYRAALGLEVSFVSSWSSLPPTQHNSTRLLLALAVSWPIGYMAADACARSLRRRTFLA